MDARDSGLTVGRDTGGEVELSGDVDGQAVGRPFGVGRHVIGSAEGCELVLRHPSVSRHHAAMVVSSSEVVVEDLGSRNGTFLNGARVERAVLESGDMLHLGLVSLVVGSSRGDVVEAALNVACTLALAHGAAQPGADCTSEPAAPRQSPQAPRSAPEEGERGSAKAAKRRRKRSRRSTR
jgi:hypothetical protein